MRLTSTEFSAGAVIHNFDCDFTVTTAGDGLWGCEAGRKINVTGICVIHNAFDDDIVTQVKVTHNSTWDIYTDTAFESAVSGALGFDVGFTEQGMQEDGVASMEC